MSNGELPKTGNMNIRELVNKTNHFIKEILKSQSSGLTYINEHDIKRMNSYIKDLNLMIDWVVKQPLLDLPEVVPTEYGLLPFTEWTEPQNFKIATIAKYFMALRTEAVNSQSSRQGSGFIGPDEVRFRQILKEVENYLTTYVAESNPLDMPESTPSVEGTGPGLGGM
jgi:hypothetical protein